MDIDIEDLKKRLIAHGNYAEVADRIKMTRSYVRYIAIGERSNPTIHTLIKIQVALDELA